ncbi:sugar porter family MFS transporter [Muribaculum intestinale]|uniref:sugar porter family MFS transporter n=2 Tax=Muribaculum intestinale TaxID=1796646 RepID=UPI000F4970A6|nr:sugar porter family MFS transporter [Muribaculum intestinale]ROT05360.1 MFS transporter [Muribaculaceae bacterium Isolate-100 (HZI)]RXE63659.1 MFS transporter [Muribaculaceae bacterium Isolate-007 (NCI)]
MQGIYNFAFIIAISAIAAMGGFLFGFDEAVISGTVDCVSTQFGLNVMASGWFVSSALLGAIIGVIVGGNLSDRYGRKSTMICSGTLFAVSMIGCAVAPSFIYLVIYRIVGGIGIGVASIVCPMYISEVAVASRRGLLVSLYQLAVTIGVVGAYVSNKWLLGIAMEDSDLSGISRTLFVDEWWRGMLGVGVIPSVIFLVSIFFIPESPRWLVLKGRMQKAEQVFARIYNNDSAIVRRQIESTLEVTRNSGSGYKALLSPGIFRAVLIGVAIAMLGQFMGVNAVLYYGPSIFKDAGLSDGDAFFYQVLVGAANMLTTIAAMFIIDKVGRKTLIYYGVSGMIISLLLIGSYFMWGQQLGVSHVLLLIFFLLYIICCAGSICAVIFVILSEMYPLAVRGAAMSVAGLALWIATFMIGQLTPWMLHTLSPAGTFLLFAIMCVPYILIMWKMVPETTGKSLEEIERYWMYGELREAANKNT